MKINNLGRRVLVAIMCLALLATFSQSEVKAYQPSKQGSITVTLNNIGTNNANVVFDLYKVGSITGDNHIAFDLEASFVDSGIDLDTLRVAEEQKKAAKIFLNHLPDTTHDTKSTDDSGKLVFEELDHGVYLINISEAGEYGVVEPFLIFLPYMSVDTQEWIYHIDSNPKGEWNPDETTGSIVITKSVLSSSNKLVNVEDTFYFTLFEDIEMTKIIATKELKFENESAKVVIFDDLPLGNYYIAETGADGSKLDSTFGYSITIDREQVILTEEDNEQEVSIKNKLPERPTEPDKPTTPRTKTGDTAPIVLLLIAFAISGILIAVFARKKHR
ncbi:MAG: sortase B protein-sorting domain-containing protein [Suipraeoptans sp.]